MTEFSGKLRERVRLERPNDVIGAGGSATRNWVAVTTAWAAVESADPATRTDQPVTFAGRPANRTRYKFTLRTLTNVNPSWRLVWDGQVFAILAIDSPPQLADRTIIIAEHEREQ